MNALGYTPILSSSALSKTYILYCPGDYCTYFYILINIFWHINVVLVIPITVQSFDGLGCFLCIMPGNGSEY